MCGCRIRYALLFILPTCIWTVGLHRPNPTFFLRTAYAPGPADTVFSYGPSAGCSAGRRLERRRGDHDRALQPGDEHLLSAEFQQRRTRRYHLHVRSCGRGLGPPGRRLGRQWHGHGRVVQSDDQHVLSTELQQRRSGGRGVWLWAAGGGVGDWDGDGDDTAGLYNAATSTFFLKNTNAAGAADMVFGYGPPGAGWTPVVGDWDGS